MHHETSSDQATGLETLARHCGHFLVLVLLLAASNLVHQSWSWLSFAEVVLPMSLFPVIVLGWHRSLAANLETPPEPPRARIVNDKR